VDAPSPSSLDPQRARRSGALGLSARLLLLTILFVMVAEVLIYVPSVANFRRTWLNDRLAAAQMAALVLDAAPAEKLSDELEARLLAGVNARAVAVKTAGVRRLLAVADHVPEVSRTYDLRTARWTDLIVNAFVTLFSPDERPVRVVGKGVGGADFVEIVLDEAPLRAAMIDFSRNILVLSLLISAITAGLVFLALHRLIVRPVRRLAGNIAAFAGDPEDDSRVITPSRRGDEIGVAEKALERMETALSGELRQKRRLAELGLAVSKINHELRNMLTTAQLLTDRLERTTDPLVERVAPRLMATLDRAISFCEATLAYGRAAERRPERRRFPLKPLVEELGDLTALAPGLGIVLDADVPDGLVVDADRDQLSRLLVNLVRNAVQALKEAGTGDGAPRIAVSARREGGTVTVLVSDNGPGLSERARANLFAAFQGSARTGGTGLGLVVSAELARLHGGALTLDDAPTGARFRLILPDRVVGGEPSPTEVEAVANRSRTL
jgi:signal transduction histidine kinase